MDNELIKSDMYCLYSDLSKDLYGSRHRFDWREYTIDQLQELIDYVSARLDAEAREEREAEEARKAALSADHGGIHSLANAFK